MSATTLNDDWVQCQSANALENDVLTWTTSLSRTRVSTADGLGFSENVDTDAMNSLESLLRTVQQLKLKKFRTEGLEDARFVAAGETFSVSQCKYEGAVVAIKRIRLKEEGKGSEHQHFQRRLHSVLREILIMCHPPLAHHPNILSLLGYGWSVEKQRLSPFISLEFATGGSVREFMKERPRSIRTKLILMGDIGAGLIALHKCGIVHGDLKADNVVVSVTLDRPSMSIAKVSDFGHSILESSAPEKRTRYFGTALYNAPEVADQKNQPIPVEQLHKCDMWAFGLCVWEILADGQVYFKRSWREDPAYRRPPSYTMSTPSSANFKPHDEVFAAKDDQNDFGAFDLYHLKGLAVEYLTNMKIPGIGFEKGFLKPLLNGTLQTDPSKRISDLSRMPIIGFWNSVPGGHSLQSSLATYTLSGDIRYAIFSRDGGPYIIWEQQQQLLQDFETVAQQSETPKNNGSTAFQTMLCYVNAFGTSKDLTKAAHFLDKANESGHLLARTLGVRISDGFSESTVGCHKTYSESLASGFRVLGRSEQSSTISVQNGESVTKFTDYLAMRDAFVNGGTLVGVDQDDITTISLSLNPSSERYSLLEIAIQQGDIELVNLLLPIFGEKLKEMNTRECLLVQAAHYGHGAIVKRLLQEGVPVARDASDACLLHWLFCLDEASLFEVLEQLRNADRRDDLKLALNSAIIQKTTLHPQWPFQIYGVPLATAVASGSISSVKSLLELKADPTAAAFADDDGNSVSTLTPIHLAIRYHFPEMVKLMWHAAFRERKITTSRLYLTPSLGRFPVACALSLMTNAERLAIHGSSFRQKLRETIELLPMEALTQSSPEGRSAITQAIDLDDVDAVDIILEYYPELAAQRLSQPGTNEMFTYPLHFAVQMCSIRDSNESVQILESFLSLDPTAINRPDSSSVRPIHAAAKGTSARIINFLLGRGSTCHDTDGRGQTPLFFCRSAGIVKALLLHGADINHKDDLGFTPVHAATSQSTDEVLHALIEGGANLRFSDNGIGAPLHCAVRRKSISMTEILLKAGVEVNAKDSHGRTPLLVAMDTGRSDLVSMLFENGADPFIEDEHGSSPFHMALSWPSAIILNKFQIHTVLATLPWETKVKALHFAAQSGEPAALKLYLHKAFGPGLSTDDPCHVYSQETRIAVHKAASVCRADLVEVLLAYGFRVDALDARGNTPLLIGCQLGREQPSFNSYARTQICETLIDNGANIYIKNHQGLSPFFIAHAHADYPLMTLLLEHALRLSDLDPSILKCRILESIKDPDKDRQYCKESRELIGDEIVDSQLIRQAAAKDEWDFFMTCVGGQFVGKEELLRVFPRRTWSHGVDSVDILRFQSARRDREIVRYLHDAGPSGWSATQKVSQIGERDLQRECSDLRAGLNTTLWPKMQRKFWRIDESGETVPRNLNERFKKRYMEFQPRDPADGQRKWGWSSDGLSDDPISSDEESESEQQKKLKIQDQASDVVDMADDDRKENHQTDVDEQQEKDSRASLPHSARSSEDSLVVVLRPSLS
ncbi:hypothetical protein N7510_010312 [Penicillium lagena]|uniref:uncharacterized protein n=1 Tax=Penicillium lagena TaxID=94218 RepID=UPI0025412B87|nr:uncharacterized protein N7510_010312 [Penicillium lagena]KAJ5605158.1 hypothetical protein N7510_010312 [Penicillium lagena]